MAIYAFGDIHGEVFKLTALIARLDIKKTDTLVFLGDYIDRGACSFEVVDFLCELDNKYDCKFLRGNHELMLMDYLAGKDYNNLFLYNGGRTTEQSYSENGFNLSPIDCVIPNQHMKFFQKLLPYYEVKDYIFVHAGIYPDTPMENLSSDILYWDRNFNYYDYNGPKTVVYGHTPSEYVLNESYKICIDTGACFNMYGNLTCVKLPERTFITQGETLEDKEYYDRNDY